MILKISVVKFPMKIENLFNKIRKRLLKYWEI